jgi:hypothetical protein
MFRLFYYLYGMKAKEHIYNLRTALEPANSSIQTYIDQHLMFMLDEARATLATRKMEGRTSVNQMAQFIDISPSVASVSELGTVGDTKVLKILSPKPIEYYNGEAIFTVGATDGQDSYTKISYSQLRTTFHRQFTASAPKWLWFNDAIYIVNSEIDSRMKVRVRGIFNQPYKVELAMGRLKRLDPFDWEYPLGLKDQDAVYKIAMNSSLGYGDAAVSAMQAKAKRDKKDNDFMTALKGLSNSSKDGES